MNIVYNMDCMEGMKEYPDKYFDLAIVDPPYGAGLAEGGGCQGWFAKYREDNQDRENKELGAHFVGRGRSKKFKDAHLEYLNGGGGTSILEPIRSKVRPIQTTDRTTKRGGGYKLPTRKHYQGANTKKNGKWCFPNWGKVGSEVRKKIISWDVAPGQDYFEELFRISRNQVIWGGELFLFATY